MDTASYLADRIDSLNRQLEEIGNEPEDVPEFSIHANTLRRNSHLAKVNHILVQLAESYAQYLAIMEETVTMTVEVQRSLLNIVKDEME